MNDREIERLLDRTTIHGKKRIKIHISQSPIKKLEISEQEIITGFNAGGRPEGIWYSYGGSWLKFLSDHSSNVREEFKPCCFMYNIVLDKKILKLDSIKKLNDFDKKYKSYWRPADDLERGSKYLKNLPYTPLGRSTQRRLDSPRFRGESPVGRSMGIKRNAEKLIKDGLILTTAQSVKHQFEDELGIDISKKDIEYYKFKRWDLVAKNYNGAEFIPYFESYRNKRFWYWTIDVASGCVWNPKGVKEFKLIARKIGENWELTDYGRDLLNQ